MVTRIREATDPETYAAQLLELLGQIGTLEGEAVAGMIDILDDARKEIQSQLALLDLESPSRAMLQRAQAGIDQTMANLLQTSKTSLAQWQAQGHALGYDLAIKPLGGERGFDVLSSATSLEQLQIMQGFSAELIQDIPNQLRKAINGELTSVIVGAKTPHAAARAIGFNLTDANHFASIAHRARAIVVTEVGRAHSLATQAAQSDLQNLLHAAGDPTTVRKRWLNGHLPGARITHLEAEAKYGPEGSIGPIDVNDFYQVGGFKALYPKDPSLPPSESVHCHCVSITVLADTAGNPETGTTPSTATVGAAKASFTGAKAKAEAPALAKQSKTLNKPAAAFLADPYGSAGLSPVKPLKNGGSGYGGKIMAAKLGYSNPAKSGFVWNPTLGAFAHKLAATNKQLPDFAKLAPTEQLGLMKAAGLSAVTRNQIIKHLDIKVKTPKVAPYAAAAPTAAPTPIPKPKPPPKPAPRPPAAAPGALAPLTARRPGPRATKPRPTIQGGKTFNDAIGQRIAGVGGVTASNYAAQTRMKALLMTEIGDALDDQFTAARLTEFENAFPKHYGIIGNPTTAGQRVSSMLIRTWAATSGDANPGSLAVQKAVAEIFDLDWPPIGYIGRNGIKEAAAFYNEWNDVLDGFVNTMYANTQRHLEALGFGETITLARGMRGLDSAVSINGELREVMLNPASSFAIRASTANNFGSGFTGATYYANVPRERILACALTGFGCLNEYEFVVIGAARPETLWAVGNGR